MLLFLTEAARVMLNIVLLVKLLGLNIPSEDISVEEVKELPSAICCMVSCSHTKHLVQFFKRLAFGFWNEEQDTEETDQVPDRIPRESTLRLECLQKRRPRDGENKVEEPLSNCQHEVIWACSRSDWIVRNRFEMPRGTPSVSETVGQKDFRKMIVTNSCCRGKRHSLSANIQWIRLGRIGEWNWAFSRRVDDSEEINTESNTSDLYLRRAGNPKTESSEEQAKRHKRESGQKQTIRKWRVSDHLFLGGRRHVSRADVLIENVWKGMVVSQEELLLRHSQIRRKVLSEYVLSAPKCVDRVNCWDGEEEVDDTEAQGGTKSTDLREVGLKEDFRGIIGDNVDTAELNRVSLSFAVTILEILTCCINITISDACIARRFRGTVIISLTLFCPRIML
jgi:hypothetical protein